MEGSCPHPDTPLRLRHCLGHSDTPDADGQLSEIEGAVSEGKPLVVIWVADCLPGEAVQDGPRRPSGLWKSKNVADFIKGLRTGEAEQLVAGIDNYGGGQFDLHGCVNDAHAVLPLLRRNEDDSPNFHCELLLGEIGSSGVVRDELHSRREALLVPGAHFALLYFAGHGEGVRGDAALVTTDATDAYSRRQVLRGPRDDLCLFRAGDRCDFGLLLQAEAQALFLRCRPKGQCCVRASRSWPLVGQNRRRWNSMAGERSLLPRSCPRGRRSRCSRQRHRCRVVRVSLRGVRRLGTAPHLQGKR